MNQGTETGDASIASGPARGRQSDAEGDFDIGSPRTAESTPASKAVPAPTPAAASTEPAPRREITKAADLERPATKPPTAGFMRMAKDALAQIFQRTDPMPEDLQTQVLKQVRAESDALLRGWEEHEAFVREVGRFLPTGIRQRRQEILRELHSRPEDAARLTSELAALDAAEKDHAVQTTLKLKIGQSLREKVVPHVETLGRRLAEVHEQMVANAADADLVSANLTGAPSAAARDRIDHLMNHWREVVAANADPSMGGRLPVTSTNLPSFALSIARRAVGAEN